MPSPVKGPHLPGTPVPVSYNCPKCNGPLTTTYNTYEWCTYNTYEWFCSVCVWTWASQLFQSPYNGPVIPQSGKDMSVSTEFTCDVCGAVVDQAREQRHIEWHENVNRMEHQLTNMKVEIENLNQIIRANAQMGADSHPKANASQQMVERQWNR